MIDLHLHLLPGLDDGPATMDEALAMARVAVDDGIRIATATPHVSRRYPTDPGVLPAALAELRSALDRDEIPLQVLIGAEIAPERLGRLSDEDLHAIALGGGPYILLECPFEPFYDLEPLVADLHDRGFEVLLGHPERAPFLRQDPAQLARLVAAGVLTAISAASLTGGFGEAARRSTAFLLETGLVHVIASDGHDARARPPVLTRHLRAAGRGVLAHAEYFTDVAPAAILAGVRPPPPPHVARRRRRMWDLLRRS